TAYYALFHLLISEATQLWKRPQDRPELARMFEHTHINTICARTRDKLNAEFKKLGKRGRLDQELAVKRHLHLVAKTFVEMYYQRESADYDFSETWTRSDVDAKVDSVASAFKAWNAIRKEEAAQ